MGLSNHVNEWYGRKIIAAFESECRWQVEEGGVVRIEPIEYPGEMGMVRWLRVHYDNGETVELNVAQLVGVRFAPDGARPVSPSAEDRERAREVFERVIIVGDTSEEEDIDIIAAALAEAREQGRQEVVELRLLVSKYHEAAAGVYEHGLDGPRIAALRSCLDSSQPIYDMNQGPLVLSEEE